MGMLLHRRALEQAGVAAEKPKEVTTLHNVTPTPEPETVQDEAGNAPQDEAENSPTEATKPAPVIRRGRPARKV